VPDNETHQPAPTDRRADALQSMASQFAEDLATLAPAEAAETTAPTIEGTPATASAPKTNGPESKTQEQPATTTTTPEASATPESTKEAETRANNERRAAAHQAKLARDLAEKEARIAELERQNQTLDFDNRVLYGTNEAAKQIAREQGGIRYDELDAAQTEAVRQTAAQRQAAEQERHAQALQAQQSQLVWQREVEARTVAGNLERERGLSHVLATAAENGIKVNRAEVEALWKEGYQDTLVQGDLKLWQDPQVPGTIARDRVAAAMQRNAEGVIAKLTTKAVQQIDEERRPVPKYDRTQVFGEPAGSGAPRGPRSYGDRQTAALAEMEKAFASDLARTFPQ
jgi:hypothetical protein